MSIDLEYKSREESSPKIYNNEVLDSLTRAHFLAPFIVFIPISAFFLYKGFAIDKVSPANLVWMVPAIVLFWSWLEWILHKFVLHYKKGATLPPSIVNKIHESHHQYPNDKMRYVVPVWASLTGGVVFYLAFRLIIGGHLINAFFGMLVLMYLFYEFCHIGAHTLNWKNKWFQKMKKHHLKHHFHDYERGFGFTSPLWDRLFRTDFEKGG